MSTIPSNWANKWTQEENDRLLRAIEEYGENNWKKVADVVGTRDAVKCLQRWEKVVRPDIIKGRWTEEEDKVLFELVSQGYKNWGSVASQMKGRTSKQCRERWCNYLDPSLLKTPFTPEEDQVILNLHQEVGNKWASIARHLPGRTENSVKLRYKSLTNGRASNSDSAKKSKTQKRPVPQSSASNEMHQVPSHALIAENADSKLPKKQKVEESDKSIDQYIIKHAGIDTIDNGNISSDSEDGRN